MTLDPLSHNLDALLALKKERGRKRMGIQEILKRMPAFYGWVPIGTTGAFMLLNGKDDGVALKLLWNKEYEATSLNIWRAITRECNAAIDIGAHTGIYSLVAALNKDLTVIAIEPVAANLSRLICNAQYNNMPNIRAIPAACTSHGRYTDFDPYKGLGYLTSGATLPNTSSEEGLRTNAIKIDTIVSTLKASQRLAIKIDIEGHEHTALAGASKTLETHRPIIMLECISHIAGSECTKTLSAMDYCFFDIDDRQGIVSRSESIKAMTSEGKPDLHRLNHLAIPAECKKDTIKILADCTTKDNMFKV